MRADPRITLIGGGLGGALLALYLGRRGLNVTLYERRSDPAAGNVLGGRSINLAISTRGLHALEAVGLRDDILKIAVPMRGRMIHPPGGGMVYQPYDRDRNRHINSVSRAELNRLLIDGARQCSDCRVFFDQRCTDVDLDAPAAILEDVRSGGVQRVESDIVIGIDGAFSVVRRVMQKLDRFDYSQQFLSHGYKELSIPPAPAGGFQLEPNALHIWPRKSFMMIALPNPDGSFTCTLFAPFEGRASFAEVRTSSDALAFFEREFPDAVPLMPTLAHDFEQNPTGSMVTVRCSPWHHQGKVALLGDAAHAVVPFYGQGANAAFEDCTVLDRCIGDFAPDWPLVFDQFQRSRKEHVDALADLAVANFVEMRDKTSSRLFRAKKKYERAMQAIFPGVYVPLYTMVSFTRIPYADAVRRARRDNRTVLASALLIVLVLVLLLLQCSPAR